MFPLLPTLLVANAEVDKRIARMRRFLVYYKLQEQAREEHRRARREGRFDGCGTPYRRK
jgi:hypothetical protein